MADIETARQHIGREVIAGAFARRLRANADHAEKQKFSVANLSTLPVADCRALADWIEDTVEFLGARAMQAAMAGARIKTLEGAIKEACDLLAERTYGSLARSPGHNARLRLEAALSPDPQEEFPQPQRKDGHQPCGECHIQPAETCDICGAKHSTPDVAGLIEDLLALKSVTPAAPNIARDLLTRARDLLLVLQSERASLAEWRREASDTIVKLTTRATAAEAEAASLAAAQWRDDEPRKDGVPFLGMGVWTMRWTLYSKNSEQHRRGQHGRWQRAREHGGWENCDPPQAWRPDRQYKGAGR